MFLTCGMVPAATTMDYKGDFQAGYQEIDGISLGYLQINGTRMFALTQVFSDLFKDIPRATVSKKMESLKIQSRRCDLKELRTLKAIQSVPMRAVKCSLISKTDLEALCTSCKALAPRKRKRKRKCKRRDPGDLFNRPRLLPPYGASDSAFRASVGASCAKRDALLGGPFAREYEKAAQSLKSYNRSEREQLLAGVLSSYPGDLQLLHSAVRAHGTDPPPGEPDAGRTKRSACGCLAKERAPSAPFAGSKRQGTSAGYSSDSDSSGASSPGSSSDSSEEEDDDEDEESSCSSEEGSSSGSESSSLCSGDSVQSTRYRQAALPRIPSQPASSPAFPGVAKALRPDPNLLFWARTLRASTLESFKPVATGASKEPQQEEPEPRLKEKPRNAPTSPVRSSSPREGPQPKNGGFQEASESCVQQEEAQEDLSKDSDSLSSREDLRVGEADKAEESDLQNDSKEGLGREAHFDRLIRQSKLWCYAKGFNVDGKGLRKAEHAKGSSSASKAGLFSLVNKPLKGGSDLERNTKRSRIEQAKGRPPKIPRKTTTKKGTIPPCKRLLSTTNPAPARNPFTLARNPFTLMGTFPCTPALVIGSDGDLCPASSLCVKDSCTLSKTHPLWTWQLGGSAIPVPPSLKFRGCSLDYL
ncbi:elongin BC and Polycomb repressive complex 2-associated protein [Hemicordylus capensis]|uniref:elongin BC and Polycomb repressive complex 2-associated protein n=1 Tax=Hemicordylus capensis TaxID=884348 RepID=UPI002304B790|nr:elongin BC and Polycomb repressive complex 2-associated protein [Hemicordylus capensis]